MRKKQALVRSYGCTANMGEGEVIQGQLEQAGYTIIPEEATLDKDPMVVLNLCTVKGDSSALKEIRKAKEEFPNSPMILSGCTTKELAEKVQELDPKISITSTHGIQDIVPMVEKTWEGQTVKDMKRRHVSRIRLPRKRENPAVGIVPICSGCLDHCSFCSTVLVKGGLHSFPVSDILAEVRDLVADGAKEIWMTGQDAACYGFDIGTNMAELLLEVCEIPGDFMIRIGMGNPRHVKKYVHELAEAMLHPKVFKFIHLPVQAGSDEVLAGMNRKHNVADYDYLVEVLREKIPDLTLSTDIIVGFPGETEAQFEQTMELLRRSRPSVCNRTRFVPRKGTIAAQMQGLTKQIKKDRSRRLTELFKEIALQEHQNFVGQTTRIIIDEMGKKTGTMLGRTPTYRQIAISGEYPIGTVLDVKISGAETFCLLGEVK